jgi:glycerol-3-phosphate dehydrogenase
LVVASHVGSAWDGTRRVQQGRKASDQAAVHRKEDANENAAALIAIVGLL